MSSIQAAPAQRYPVGESFAPSKASLQTFLQRQVALGEGSFSVTGFTDPNTAADFFVELQLASDSSWVIADSTTCVGAPGGPQNRNGPIGTLTFSNVWATPIAVTGARLRVVVRDAVPGSGLAKQVSLGAITLTWN